jgi:hypothetical protein
MPNDIIMPLYSINNTSENVFARKIINNPKL